MVELHGVHQRLEAALGRLDSVVESHINTAVSRARIDELTKELEQASIGNAKLYESTDAVARRLDATIERIRAILGD